MKLKTTAWIWFCRIFVAAFVILFALLYMMIYIWSHPSHLVLVNRTTADLIFKAPGCEPTSGTVKRAAYTVVRGPSTPPGIEYSGTGLAPRTAQVTSQTVSIKEPGEDNVYVLELR